MSLPPADTNGDDVGNEGDHHCGNDDDGGDGDHDDHDGDDGDHDDDDEQDDDDDDDDVNACTNEETYEHQ